MVAINKNLILLYCASALLFGCDSSSRDDAASAAINAENNDAGLTAERSCADDQAILVEGTGQYSRSIGGNAEAQAFFDQGLRLTYSYYFPEALASFDAALCFDAANPMIHWGRALAIAPNPNSRYSAAPDDPVSLGKDAIAQAQQLVGNSQSPLAEVDQRLIDTLGVLFDTETHPDQVARSAAFIHATQTLYEQFPDDMEVAFLAADAIMMATPWQYFSTDDGTPINQADKAQTILEAGMAQHPEHPGLTHMHIHLMENSFAPEQAEPSADRLESLTPKAGHMVHMPGHIYMRVGRYADAIATNERSLQADEYFVQAWEDRPLPSGTTYGLSARVHGPHARNFIHWGAVLQGNSDMALSTVKTMVDGLTPQRISSGSGQRTIASYWMTLRFFSRWEDILNLPENPDLPPYLQGMRHFVRGSAYAVQNSVEQAQEELAALQIIQTNPDLANQRASVNTADNLLGIAQHILAGDVAKAQENYQVAIAHYQQAVSGQDSLRYMEPPDWLQSTRLSLGQAYLDAENYADAETVFKEDLGLLRENGWALYGLLQSLQAQQQDQEVEAVAARYGKAWENADLDLGNL